MPSTQASLRHLEWPYPIKKRPGDRERNESGAGLSDCTVAFFYSYVPTVTFSLRTGVNEWLVKLCFEKRMSAKVVYTETDRVEEAQASTSET